MRRSVAIAAMVAVVACASEQAAPDFLSLCTDELKSRLLSPSSLSLDSSSIQTDTTFGVYVGGRIEASNRFGVQLATTFDCQFVEDSLTTIVIRDESLMSPDGIRELYREVGRSTLRNLLTAQDAFYAEHQRLAHTLAELGSNYVTFDGVEVQMWDGNDSAFYADVLVDSRVRCVLVHRPPDSLAVISC